MSKPRWIAGPYRVDPDHRPGMAYNRHIVLDRDHDQRIAFMAHDGDKHDEAFKATASLLAAAPDIYEALAVVIRLGARPWIAGAMVTWPEWDAAMEAAEQALAKARGDGL